MYKKLMYKKYNMYLVFLIVKADEVGDVIV